MLLGALAHVGSTGGWTLDALDSERLEYEDEEIWCVIISEDIDLRNLEFLEKFFCNFYYSFLSLR